MLVVDDSPTVRQQLSLAFERMGMRCASVDSAAHALRRLATQHIDLVLADVVMPDMDGYKLTREIKRNKQTRHIPVIILTSKSSPFDLARGALAGCDSYLSKPVPMRALEAAVVKQLRKSLAIDDLSTLVRTADPVRAKPAADTGSRRRPLSQWWSRSGS
ncbi:MAG: response regulator [Burkholderiaceae bacterium]